MGAGPILVLFCQELITSQHVDNYIILLTANDKTFMVCVCVDIGWELEEIVLS